MLVKKYGNRRLYDTESSQYITLDDLTQRIREGAEVRVVDARSNADLTQETLTQIIIQGRGADRILPASLLHQLIRLGDDALADFLGRYVQGALELYLQARRTSQSLMPFNPMLALFGQTPLGPVVPPPVVPPEPGTTGKDDPQPPEESELEVLRRELEEIKTALKRRRR